MAFGDARTAGTNTKTAAATTLAATVTVTSGDLVAVCFAIRNAILASCTIADNLNGGQSWTALSGPTSTSNRTLYKFYAIANASGSMTVTLTFTSFSGDAALIVQPFEGPFDATPLDKNPTNNSNDSTWPITCPATGTLAQADELILGFYSTGNGQTATGATSPFTLRGTATTGTSSNTIGGGICSYVATATTTRTPEFTGSGTMIAELGTASFKKGATGTTYTISLSGGVTPAGVIVRVAQKVLVGGVAPAGVIVRVAGRLFSGAATSVGTIVRKTSRAVGRLVNEVLYSTDLTNLHTGQGYSFASTSAQDVGSTDPEGNTRWSLKDTVINVRHGDGWYVFPEAAVGESLVYSRYFKYTSGLQWVRLTIADGRNSLVKVASFDIQNKVVGTLSSGVTAGIELHPTDSTWVRCWMTYTQQAGAGSPDSSCETYLAQADAADRPIYVGATTGVGVYGMQIERNRTRPTAYRATFGAEARGAIVDSSAALVTSRLKFKNVSGAISSIVGTIVRKTFKLLSASGTPTGTLIRKVQTSFAGSIATAGIDTLMTTHRLSGTIASAGAIIRQAKKILAGTIASSGVVGRARTTVKSLAGAVTPAGALVIKTTHLLVASIASVGVLVIKTIRLFAGAIASAGTLVRTTTKKLSATIASSAVVTRTKLAVVSFVAGILSAGVLVKQVTLHLSASNSPVGVLARSTTRLISGAIASSGVVVRSTQKLFTGVIGSAGTVVLNVKRLLSATMSVAGSLVRQTTKLLSGAIALSGIVGRIKAIIKPLAGVIASSSVVATSTTKALFGNAGIVGTLLARPSRIVLTAAIVFDGLLEKTTTKLLDAVVNASGIVFKRVGLVLAGSVSSNGVLRLAVGYGLNGTVLLVGSVAMAVYKIVSGVTALSGEVLRQTKILLGGSVVLAGSLVRNTLLIIEGLVDLDGSLQRESAIHVSGSVWMMADITTTRPAHVDGQIGLYGLVSAFIRRVFDVNGLIGMAGSLTHRVTKAFAALVRPVGKFIAWVVGKGLGRIRSRFASSPAVRAVFASMQGITSIFGSRSAVQSDDEGDDFDG